MTRQLLEKIVKAKKIDLTYYDHVAAFINESYTYIYVSFWAHESINGTAYRCGEKTVRLSVSSILKREEEFPEDYETKSAVTGEWIYNIK